MTEPMARHCGHPAWDDTRIPRCPHCQAETWIALPGFISEKHAPGAERERSDEYRSTLTPHFAMHVIDYLIDAAQRGHWFYDVHYECWIHFTPRPLDRTPGVGQAPGEDSPSHALNSMLIADAVGDAHVFAQDEKMFRDQVDAGQFMPLRHCDIGGCDALRDPGAQTCLRHGELSAKTRAMGDGG